MCNRSRVERASEPASERGIMSLSFLFFSFLFFSFPLPSQEPWSSIRLTRAPRVQFRQALTCPFRLLIVEESSRASSIQAEPELALTIQDPLEEFLDGQGWVWMDGAPGPPLSRSLACYLLGLVL